MSPYSEYTTPSVVAAICVVTSAALYNVLGRAVHRYLVSKQTALNDVPKLGQPANRKGKIRGTAVISGGSIAGLWTARVCADHFEKVIVIEPETWVSSNKDHVDPFKYTTLETREHDGLRSLVNKRTRVRQFHYIHGYQPIAMMAFRKLFTRIVEVARSMNVLIRPNEAHVHLSGIPINAPYHEYPTGQLPEVMVGTRASLETILRKLVKESDACLNVEFIHGTVTGIVPSSTKPNRLEGVQIRLDGQKETQLLTGELFVDCTGPTQAFFKWLPRAGYGFGGPKPLTDLRLHYEQRMVYSDAYFHLTPEMQAKLSAMIPPKSNPTGSSYLNEGWDEGGWLCVLHPIAEVDNKVLFAKKMEGGMKVEATFGAWAPEAAPRNKAQMLEFIQGMVMAPGYEFPSWISDLLGVLCDESAEEPIIGICPTPSSSHVQYHLASNLPSNFVATGDALMELNPVFGHGCSKACIDAITLNASLSDVKTDTLPDDFGKRFFNVEVGRALVLWNQAKDQDYRYVTTKPIPGEEAIQEKALLTQGGFPNAYLMTLLKLSQTDKYIASTLWHIFSLLAPPTDLFSPRVIAKVAWAKLWGVV